MLKIAFIALFVYLVLQLTFAIRRKEESTDTTSSSLKTFFGLLTCWVGYLLFISWTGVLQNFNLPPRLPLLVILPAFLFIIVFFVRKDSRSYLESIPRTWPVYFQSFRILVELLIWKSFLTGFLPKQATFEGYNYEIIVGLSALLVGYLFAKGFIPVLVVQIWNAWGLMMLATIVFIFMSAGFFPGFWESKIPMVSLEFANMPYLLLAGFFMPLAIFVHIFSLRQLSLQKAE